jgi:hypothetical protein
MRLREIVTKVLINPIIRTKPRHFRHANHPTRDNMLQELLSPRNITDFVRNLKLHTICASKNLHVLQYVSVHALVRAFVRAHVWSVLLQRHVGYCTLLIFTLIF